VRIGKARVERPDLGEEEEKIEEEERRRLDKFRDEIERQLE